MMDVCRTKRTLFLETAAEIREERKEMETAFIQALEI